MAKRFERCMEHHVAGHQADKNVNETPAGVVVAAPGGTIEGNPYSVDDEMLKEWVKFLKHCGGFQMN